MRVVQLTQTYNAHFPGEFASFSDAEAEFILGRNPKSLRMGIPAMNVRLTKAVLRDDAEKHFGRGLYPQGAPAGRCICLVETRAKALIKAGIAEPLVMATLMAPHVDGKTGRTIRETGSFATTPDALKQLKEDGIAQEFFTADEQLATEKSASVIG